MPATARWTPEIAAIAGDRRRERPRARTPGYPRAMPAEIVRCPGCGAADTSVATPQGIHTCVYCGVRYQLQHGTPKTLAPVGAARASSQGPIIAAVVGGAVVIVGLAVVLLFIARADDAPRIAEADRANAVVSVPAIDPSPSPTPTIGGDGGGSTPTVSVTPPEEELAPATAEFTYESQRMGGDALWIYGFVTNTSPFPLGKSKVSAILLDEGGAEVGVASSFAEYEVVAPGERSPISILVQSPPKHAKISFEVHAERPFYLPTLAAGLELESPTPKRDNFLGWKIAGKVHNKGTTPAEFVRVDVLAYDSDDKLANLGFTYADAEVLKPGASARFDTTLLGAGKRDFTRFEFHVSGKVAD